MNCGSQDLSWQRNERSERTPGDSTCTQVHKYGHDQQRYDIAIIGHSSVVSRITAWWVPNSDYQNSDLTILFQGFLEIPVLFLLFT